MNQNSSICTCEPGTRPPHQQNLDDRQSRKLSQPAALSKFTSATPTFLHHFMVAVPLFLNHMQHVEGYCARFPTHSKPCNSKRLTKRRKERYDVCPARSVGSTHGKSKKRKTPKLGTTHKQPTRRKTALHHAPDAYKIKGRAQHNTSSISLSSSHNNSNSNRLPTHPSSRTFQASKKEHV